MKRENTITLRYDLAIRDDMIYIVVEIRYIPDLTATVRGSNVPYVEVMIWRLLLGSSVLTKKFQRLNTLEVEGELRKTDWGTSVNFIAILEIRKLEGKFCWRQ